MLLRIKERIKWLDESIGRDQEQWWWHGSEDERCTPKEGRGHVNILKRYGWDDHWI